MFGKRLEKLIGEAGYTRKTFCAACGIAEATLCRYLNGERTPTIRKVEVIARTLGVDPAFLMEDGDSDPYEELSKSVGHYGRLLSTGQRLELALSLVNRDPAACSALKVFRE